MKDEAMEENSMQVVIEISNEIVNGPIYKILSLSNIPFDDKISIVTTTLSASLGMFLKECIAIGKVKDDEIDRILEEFTEVTKDGIKNMQFDDFTRKIMGDQKIIGIR